MNWKSIVSRCNICNCNSLENPEKHFTFNSDSIEWLCDECIEAINSCLSEFIEEDIRDEDD
jgi:hypothetical protein